MSKKSIILGAPYHFGLDQRIKENLEFHGFEVELLKLEPQKYKISLKDWMIHNYKKSILKDKGFKAKRMAETLSDKLIGQINKTYDYSLFIRPDMYSQALVEKACASSKKSIAYQWDGLSRHPVSKPMMAFFDDFYVFDENDLKEYSQCKIADNFYFDDLLPSEENICDIAFVGTLMPERLPLLNVLLQYFAKYNIVAHIHVQSRKNRFKNNPAVRHYKKGIGFKQNLEIIQASKSILDFQNPRHSGLSLRVFESIGYEKKLITTNALVKNHDFYRPENMFVLTEANIHQLQDFLNQDYCPLPEALRLKYSFGEWLKAKIS
jgi:hypothetical protein